MDYRKKKVDKEESRLPNGSQGKEGECIDAGEPLREESGEHGNPSPSLVWQKKEGECKGVSSVAEEEFDFTVMLAAKRKKWEEAFAAWDEEEDSRDEESVPTTPEAGSKKPVSDVQDTAETLLAQSTEDVAPRAPAFCVSAATIGTNSLFKRKQEQHATNENEENANEEESLSPSAELIKEKGLEDTSFGVTSRVEEINPEKGTTEGADLTRGDHTQDSHTRMLMSRPRKPKKHPAGTTIARSIGESNLQGAELQDKPSEIAHIENPTETEALSDRRPAGATQMFPFGVMKPLMGELQKNQHFLNRQNGLFAAE